MPYRSHVQQLLPEEILDGDDEFVERDVRDGTSEPESSESNSESSSSEIDVAEEAGLIAWRAKRVESASRVALSYCVWMTSRVWYGRLGLGATILEGEMERPLGMDCELTRRCSRLVPEEREELWCDDEDLEVLPGMSRMLSLRPVVGSVVWSLAGSCDTW